MTGGGNAADLAGMLSEVDEFLRSPAGYAGLEGFYRARGSIAPGFEAGCLIDAVGLAALRLRGQTASQAQRR